MSGTQVLVDFKNQRRSSITLLNMSLTWVLDRRENGAFQSSASGTV